jgi:hypothetical protein
VASGQFSFRGIAQTCGVIAVVMHGTQTSAAQRGQTSQRTQTRASQRMQRARFASPQLSQTAAE